MESLTSKAAYLKGLCDGMELDCDKAANKLIVKIIDAISDIAAAVDDVNDAHDELEELVHDIDEDLHDLEELVYDESDMLDDDEEDDDGQEDDFELLDYEDDEDDMGFFEIQCPNCNEDVMVDFETLDDDSPIICPNCHQEIELEFDCDCGCDDCGDKHDEE